LAPPAFAQYPRNIPAVLALLQKASLEKSVPFMAQMLDKKLAMNETLIYK